MSDPLKPSKLLELHLTVDPCHVPRLRPVLLGTKPSKDTSPRPWLRTTFRGDVRSALSHFRASQPRSKSETPEGCPVYITHRNPLGIRGIPLVQQIPTTSVSTSLHPHFQHLSAVKWELLQELHPTQHLTIKQPLSTNLISVTAK